MFARQMNSEFCRSIGNLIVVQMEYNDLYIETLFIHTFKNSSLNKIGELGKLEIWNASHPSFLLGFIIKSKREKNMEARESFSFSSVLQIPPSPPSLYASLLKVPSMSLYLCPSFMPLSRICLLSNCPPPSASLKFQG